MSNITEIAPLTLLAGSAPEQRFVRFKMLWNSAELRSTD